MIHRNRTHHRPSVRRLPHGLGAMRWLTQCDTCGFWRTATFWRSALAKANIHAEGSLR